MSYRQGIFLAFSGLVAMSAASAQAQDVYRKSETVIYADDDFWYGGQNRVTNSRFRRMDLNNDGIVTRSEWRGNARSFTNQDWNNDGVLSGREVRANAVRVRNRNARGEAIDRDRNGRIDRGEWLGSRNEFKRLDRDNDGYISSDEARLRYFR